MLQTKRFVTVSVLLLLGFLSTVLAHGHDDPTMDMAMSANASHGSMALPGVVTDGTPLEPSYFNHGQDTSWIYAHALFMGFAWVSVLPLAVMLSIARSRFTLPVQLLFLTINALGMVTGIVYNGKTPDLYENNVHHKVGWIFTSIACGWILMTIARTYIIKTKPTSASRRPFLEITQQAMESHQKFHDNNGFEQGRWSNDSGQGTECNTDSLCDSPRALSLSAEDPLWKSHPAEDDDDDVGNTAETEKRSFLKNTSVDRFLSRKVSRITLDRTATVLTVAYVGIERVILVLGFVAIVTGIVTFSGVFKDHNIFTGLAHCIKGAIFLGYGILSFGRWMGCFSDFGWAWNLKPGPELVGRRKAGIPTAEFTESFVIWLYGATNVFLEHLSNWGEEWSAIDLQHISITIMFFGGGILGMLVESSKIRNFLNSAITYSEDGAVRKTPQWQTPKSYVHPLNPLPALIIMLLGIMMSSHTQHSMISGMVHKQWGTLFVGFALARGLTYVTFWLKPPTSYLPSRPPTEIITAFCLMSGGIIFMASNGDTVEALERYHLDAMFVFTVTMGVTALLMAWTVTLVAIKGWAVRLEQRRSSKSHTSIETA